MPEGPEIWLAAQSLRKALRGREVREAFFAFPQLASRLDEVVGRVVEEVEPRGKAMLVRFVGGLNLYSHNQLYGKWFVRKPGDLPSTGRSLRVALHNDAHSALLYSASEIELLADEELPEHPFLARIGPDVLDSSVQAADVVERLRDRRFAGRRLTALLLDQGFLCGLGNYLRSEILFVARAHPEARPKDLQDDQLELLADTILTIARRALRHRGITNDPDHVRELRAAGWPRARLRHFVFGRDGLECHLCGCEIVRVEAGSRRLYLCPACQGAADYAD